MEFEDSFGALVRRRREALRLSRGALAELVACSEATIKKIERDERRPSPEVAALLAKHLLIPAAEREEFQLWARGVRSSRSVGSAYPPPPFARRPVPARSDVFVARERELAYLSAQLEHALAHDGRVVFVTGSAGSGKSSLVRVFAEQSCDQYPNLVAVSGACTAYVGVGDPYLPFREQLDLLTGEIALSYEAGGIGDDIAQRLWELLPHACDALLDQGTDLIGTFRSSHALVARVGQALDAGAPIAAQAARLQALLAQRLAPAPLHQFDLFTQYTRVLQRLAEHCPLVLIVEDLQWADEGSLSLLFHLGRRLAGRRILIVGIYRPLEPGSSAEMQQPLQSVINELQRIHGTRAIDLGQIDRQGFVEALLDTEPNRLGPAFRDALYHQTGGHALFTVETLRDMQERGALLRDPSGAWVEGPSLGWATLPARVEGVIRERFDRVSAGVRALLTAASVEGESFTAEVAAAALGLAPNDVNHTLSVVLSDQHHLVDFEAARDVDGRHLNRYRFRHNLFQTYLYGAIGPTERARLHLAVGAALERLYARNLEWVAPQLARHYVAAGAPSDAIRALAIAADGARRLFALGEALRSYDQAIALAEAHPEALGMDDLRDLHEQRGRTRAEAGEFAGAVADLEVALAGYSPNDPRRRGTLAALGMTHRRQDHYDAARACLAEALELARAADDAPAVANILYHLGTVEWSDGDNAAATPLHQEAVTICRREGLGGVVAIQALHGWAEALFALGRPDRAVEMFAESLALARESGDRSYEAENLMMLGFSYAGFMGAGQYREALASFDEALTISRAAQLDWHTGYILAGRGVTKGRAGDYQGGIADLAAALALKLSAGTARYQIMALDYFGDLAADLGEHERTLALREQALRLAREIGAAFWLPRQQANLAVARLALGDTSGAALLTEALALARRRKQGFHAVRCLEALAELEVVRGAYAEAAAYADQLMELARAGGMAEYVAIAHFWRGRALLGAAQRDKAQLDLRQAAAAAGAARRPILLLDAHRVLAELCAADGRIADAEHHHAAAEAASLLIRRPLADVLAVSLVIAAPIPRSR
jgi:tetratricopeptide (TPR) repeat protein/transcriptional regulator with XRE-family HTH domain